MCKSVHVLIHDSLEKSKSLPSDGVGIFRISEFGYTCCVLYLRQLNDDTHAELHIYYIHAEYHPSEEIGYVQKRGGEVEGLLVGKGLAAPLFTRVRHGKPAHPPKGEYPNLRGGWS